MEKSIVYRGIIAMCEETTNGRSKAGVTFSNLVEVNEADETKNKNVATIKVISKGVEVDGNGVTISWKNLLKAMYGERQAKFVGVRTANNPQTSTSAKGILCALATSAPCEFVREFYKIGDKNPDTNEILTEPYWRTIIRTLNAKPLDANDFAMLASTIQIDCDAKGLPKTNGNGLQFMM